jgi:predicted Rossmann-fold nucleotide-binding protein
MLVDAGYGVITGGYGGVMEGASRGAVEAGVSVGVTCAAFPAVSRTAF